MATVKSKLLNQFLKNYPNFQKKDLEKFSNIVLNEIMQALQRGERVELRGFGIFRPKNKNQEYLETLKQERKLIHLKRGQFTLKWQKICLKN